jgi:hypothetical protein
VPGAPTCSALIRADLQPMARANSEFNFSHKTLYHCKLVWCYSDIFTENDKALKLSDAFCILQQSSSWEFNNYSPSMPQHAQAVLKDSDQCMVHVDC